MRRQLAEQADRLSQAESIARFGVWKWDIRSGRVSWSEALERIYGLEPGAFEGTVDGFVARLHPDDRQRVWAHIEEAISSLEPFAFEERIIRADGEHRVLLSQGHVIAGPDRRAAALVGVCHDVTERKHTENALGHTQRRMRAIVDNTPSIVAVKDLEGRYLMANAECGRVLGVSPDHLVGRECAELFPRGLAERLRANDRRAAADGEPIFDEVVLMQDGEPRDYVTVTFALRDEEGRPIETCTIGTDVTESRERESERRERLQWEERINGAMRDGLLLVHTQPVIELASGEEASRELLVRMRAHDGALIGPGAFLPAAERFRLVQAVDLWMVRQAIALADRMNPDVNLSAVSIADPPVREEIVALLAAAPAAAAKIVFEITETAALEHLDAAQAFANAATELGCGLALDDFGTGFGSFTYLRKLPLRFLKIDRSFVTDVVTSDDDRRIVQSIIGIAEQFGLKTIAEGIEDAETLEFLRAAGASHAQGFHLGRPVPVAQARAAATAR